MDLQGCDRKHPTGIRPFQRRPASLRKIRNQGVVIYGRSKTSWFRVAAQGVHDLVAAQLAAHRQPVVVTSSYHCQQAAEKALMAISGFTDMSRERTMLNRFSKRRRFRTLVSHMSDAAEHLTPLATLYRTQRTSRNPDREAERPSKRCTEASILVPRRLPSASSTSPRIDDSSARTHRERMRSLPETSRSSRQ